MHKVYALQDAGINEGRLKVAIFEMMGKPHAVLVVDNRYVLDNLDSNIRSYSDYARFEPMLAAIPANLVARPAHRGSGAVVIGKSTVDLPKAQKHGGSVKDM